jgi:hypothetical protein
MNRFEYLKNRAKIVICELVKFSINSEDVFTYLLNVNVIFYGINNYKNFPTKNNLDMLELSIANAENILIKIAESITGI